MEYQNTLERGSVRYIVFKEDNEWYGVGLEFNIVESGDDPREVMHLLFEAMEGYVKAARKSKVRPMVLNQTVDAEYERLWRQLNQRRVSIPSRIPIKSVYTFGTKSAAPVLA